MLRKIFLVTTALALACALVGCQDFLSGENLDTDPNRATTVAVDNLFVGVQVNMYGILAGPLTFLPPMWMQQMSGVAQQYAPFEIFDVQRGEFSDAWFDIYGGGGLIDINELKERGLGEGKRTLVGITKLWEALLISSASFFWGDIPYSEAARSDVAAPVYDSQASVRDQVLQLIDSAIADLNAGQAQIIAPYDFTFAGDVGKWVRAAHTLKARILLNWAEVNNANYAAALAEAQQGISATADNWVTKHSPGVGEENLWFQFEQARRGYMRAGFFLVDLLKSHNDPRLQIYFDPAEATGEYQGSHPAEYPGDKNVSWLAAATYGSADWDTELLTWHETQFIIAECQFATGNESGALATLNNVIQPGLEAKWGLAANALPRYSGLSGAAALEAIMVEKYKALFLNQQIWSDWRRTNYPVFNELPLGRDIARRYIYPESELNTNPNFPSGDTFLSRNANDPN